MLEFRLLGTLEVLYDGVAVQIPRGKPQAILVILLMRRGKPASAERLIELLWPSRPPVTARDTLYTHIRRLRKAFEEAGIVSPVETTDEGYVIRTERRQLDTERFDKLASHGRAAAAREKLEDAWEGLGQATSLWRDDEPLRGVECPAVTEDDMTPVKLARETAQQDLCDVGLRLKRCRDVLPVLRQLYKNDPLRERVQELLLIAEYADGGQARGLAVFENIRRRLADDAGLDPSERLRWLQEQIYFCKPALGLLRPARESF